MESRNLATIQSKPSGIAVYRDSFCSLKKTVDLFERSPHIASHVRRVWFNGYNVAETNAYAFELFKHCSGLQSATIPWTALRHGSVQDWVQLLHVGPTSGGLNSLELLAVDLKHSQITNSNNARDETPLESSLVDFSRLRRLKIFGDTKFQPIVDRDLRLIARTAVNLEEIHITGLSSVTIEGVMTLVRASRHHLRVLEYSPLSNDGFERPEPSPVRAGEHMCDDLLDCPRLRDLSISLPSICPALFSSESVKWSGEVQIRTAGPCGHEGVNIISEESWRTSFWDVLEKARRLMARRDREDANLDIQIFISRWIFEPKFALVHGNYDLAEIASDLSWPLVKEASGKGPYGHTGLYGKDEGSYSSVSEVEFLEGLRQRYIGL
ncbi:MAG: hypothetical protein M1825_002940 [Sarcosagium campestre]|nr:MAG: hypothetical protein M1825_002940 [Sarcosagium campestre]